MIEEAGESISKGGLTPLSGLVGNLGAQRLLLMLMSPNHPIGQVLRFGLMTATSASVTIGLPIILHEFLGVPPQHGAAIAFVLAFLLNFVSLRRLVFRSERAAGRDFLTFLISSIVFRCGEYLAFLLLIDHFHVYYIIALIGVLMASTVAKFLWYRKALHRH